jgi:hypothetical protein
MGKYTKGITVIKLTRIHRSKTPGPGAQSVSVGSSNLWIKLTGSGSPCPCPCWHEDWTYRGCDSNPKRQHQEKGWSPWSSSLDGDSKSSSPIRSCGKWCIQLCCIGCGFMLGDTHARNGKMPGLQLFIAVTLRLNLLFQIQTLKVLYCDAVPSLSPVAAKDI